MTFGLKVNYSLTAPILTLDGYRTIIGTQKLYRPFLNSVTTTVLGTLLGLTLSTLGGYVLVQFDMPGRNIFAYVMHHRYRQLHTAPD